VKDFGLEAIIFGLSALIYETFEDRISALSSITKLLETIQGKGQSHLAVPIFYGVAPQLGLLARMNEHYRDHVTPTEENQEILKSIHHHYKTIKSFVSAASKHHPIIKAEFLHGEAIYHDVQCMHLKAWELWKQAIQSSQECGLKTVKMEKEIKDRSSMCYRCKYVPNV